MVDGLETDPPAPHRRSSRRPRTSFLPQRNSYPGRRRSSPSGRYVVIAEMIFPAMKMIASMKEKMGFVPGKILLEPEKTESRWKRIFFVPQKTFWWCLSSGGKSDSSYPAHPIKREHQPLFLLK